MKKLERLKKLLSKNKKSLLLVVGVTLLVGMVISAVLLNNAGNETRKSGDEDKDKNLFSRIEQLGEKSENCGKGLKEVESLDINKEVPSSTEQQAVRLQIADYKIQCLFKLEKYDEAILEGERLLSYMDTIGAPASEKKRVSELVASMKVTRDTIKIDEKYKDQPKEQSSGPYL